MVDQPDLCNSLWTCVHEFQALATGILAIVAAGITAVSIWLGARAPIKASQKTEFKLQERRRQYVCMSLSHELISLRNRAAAVAMKSRPERQTLYQQREVYEANLLLLPSLLASWEDMSLLPDETAQACFDLARKIRAHNFDVTDGYNSGGVGGRRLLSQIEKQALQLATELSLLADDKTTLRLVERIYAHVEGLAGAPDETGKEGQ